jgi:hypothetical protein
VRHIKRRNAGSVAKVTDLAIAAPQIIANRTARMLAAGANPGTADRREFSQMFTEKVQAFWESLFSMGVQALKTNQSYAQEAALQWWRLWTTRWWLPAMRPALHAMATLPRAAALVSTPSASQHARAMSKLIAAGLGPIHKRATANARRLRRTRKRRV